MRIGIVLHPYDEDKPAGLARTIFELAKGMIETDKKNEYIIYLKKKPRVSPELPGSFRIEILGGGRFWLENLRRATRADVYIFNTPMMPLFWKPPRSIVLALDFAYWYLAPITVKSQISKWVTFLLHSLSLRRADLIIAISEATKKDLTQLFKIGAESIKVIYCGFKRISLVLEQKKELPQKYFFFAGIIKQRKNVLNIVKAFHLFQKENLGYSLVIGGNGAGEYYESVRRHVYENKIQDTVAFIGHLNDGELSYAYKHAEALVFPTLIEGFGYPVLEAMDCEIPVITSNQSSLSEIGGDGSALLVNPYDHTDIARAMAKIVHEPGLRRELVMRGRMRAAQFSWQKAAHEVLSLVENATTVPPSKTIFITISRGIIFRNFFHTGVIDLLLKKGFRIVALVPHDWDERIISVYTRDGLIFEKLLPPSPEPRSKLLLNEFSKGAVFNSTVNVRYRYQYVGGIPSMSLYALRLMFLAPLRYMPGLVFILRAVEYALYPEKECDALFLKYKPALLFNTAMGQDFALMKGAQRYGVSTVGMPKSWDSSSKILCRTRADHILAWGPFMRDQLVRFQKYKPEEIIITGVPQFDVYAQKNGFENRESFCKKSGLDPTKKIILYISTGGNRCDEMDYLELLHRFMEMGELKDCQVLIRPHVKYEDDAYQFLPLEKYANFIVDKRDEQKSILRDNWDISKEHLTHLSNSMHHADIVINIASTIILDAAACGAPSVNICFDIKKYISPHRSVKRLLASDYISAATNIGRTWLVKSEREFLSAIKTLLEAGRESQLHAAGREKLISHMMYKNDGGAAKRIADALEYFAG